MDAPLGRRERKKIETRGVIESTAWRLFARKGFDATTVEDIADAADIATRTFFRYFDSKEAVLFGDWRADLDDFRERLLHRPVDEAPLAVIEAALLTYSERLEADRPILLQRARLATSSEQVGRYQQLVIRPAWEAVLTDAFARRLDTDAATDLRPRLYAGAVFAALDATTVVWMTADGNESVTGLLREAFVELEQLGSHAGVVREVLT